MAPPIRYLAMVCLMCQTKAALTPADYVDACCALENCTGFEFKASDGSLAHPWYNSACSTGNSAGFNYNLEWPTYNVDCLARNATVMMRDASQRPAGTCYFSAYTRGVHYAELPFTMQDTLPSRVAPAFFCEYDCRGSGRPTRPGKCFLQDEIFDTGGDSYLMAITRSGTWKNPFQQPEPEPGVALQPMRPEWATFSAGDMTWEGWFKVRSRPAQRSCLMCTYGTNDAIALFSGVNRRRHGAIWLETDGSVSLSTNVGTSSGYIAGPNIVDDRWHHVAAVWNATGGGAKITRRFKYFHVQHSSLRPGMLIQLGDNIRAAFALEANASADDIRVEFQDLQVALFEGITGVTITVNSALETVDMMVARIIRSDQFVARMMNALFTVSQIEAAITGLREPYTDNVYIFDIELPTWQNAGSAYFYVDLFQYVGRLTFSPTADPADNIVTNGQFVAAGGHQGRPVDCQAAHIKLWSVALTVQQLAQVQDRCATPTAESVIGGAYPHSLHAHWHLSGNGTNSFGPMQEIMTMGWNEVSGTGYDYDARASYPYWRNMVTGQVSQTKRVAQGGYKRGGACNYFACPPVSEGCPLGRSLDFTSKRECQAFANWNHCKLAGSSRGRPSMSHLSGCHVGPASSSTPRHFEL
eukprot:TRINITY_DN34562_c0_g1_i1.p1 TRINITY_DN34562_c0_g1~~TRINITY_DN34562_c0_g1_i1.p1  ORF type:complete len:640 (+),score=67.99 TRINITY_DN34562_c0_g1_i1:29-1948(+)